MIFYNIPCQLLDSYAEKKVIIRSEEPEDLAAASQEASSENLRRLELLSLHGNLSRLSKVANLTDLDIRVRPHEADEKLFSQLRELCGSRLRIVVPIEPGLARCLKLSISEGFPAKMLFLGDSATSDLMEAFDCYVHDASTTQPVEFFHTVLRSFFHDSFFTLWDIQEENPEKTVYVRTDGTLTPAERLSKIDCPEPPDSFLKDLKRRFLLEQGICSRCEIFAHCIGYFRLSDPEFDCAGMRQLLLAIKEAGLELKRDYESYLAAVQ